MNKIQELRNRIRDLELEITRIEQAWEPKGGGWYITDVGSVGEANSCDSYRKYGIEFDSNEDATEAAKVYRRYHRLYKLAEELNNGGVVDHSDPDQHKFFVTENHNTGDLAVFQYIPNHHHDISGVFFIGREAADKALEIVEAGGLD